MNERFGWVGLIVAKIAPEIDENTQQMKVLSQLLEQNINPHHKQSPQPQPRSSQQPIGRSTSSGQVPDQACGAAQ